jgi:Family of unknown function (DUF6527)
MSRVRRINNQDGSIYGYEFVCPGCSTDTQYVKVWGREHVIDGIKKRVEVHRIPAESGTGTGWQFNDDENLPSFSPSILVYPSDYFDPDKDEVILQSPRCHSVVTDGRIEFLADCTHSLAGQTVDLPEIEL